MNDNDNNFDSFNMNTLMSNEAVIENMTKSMNRSLYVKEYNKTINKLKNQLNHLKFVIDYLNQSSKLNDVGNDSNDIEEINNRFDNLIDSFNELYSVQLL